MSQKKKLEENEKRAGTVARQLRAGPALVEAQALLSALMSGRLQAPMTPAPEDVLPSSATHSS